MRRAAMGIVLAGLFQAEGAVHGQPHIRGVRVLLPIVLPPANGAQSQCIRRLQRLMAAAGAAKTSLNQRRHI